MAYVGRSTDKISNIEKLDTIVFDGSSSYTLQKNSVNFTPNSANSLQVSIDGVVQAGNFTVSGSTIDFGVAIPATSTNDFIFHYGTGLITTPADGTVTTGKLGDSAVTTAKINDGAITSAKMFSGFANGITMADQWRLTTQTNNSTDADITTNWERVDTDSYGGIGTGLTESSGIFSFPQTGIYRIIASFTVAVASGDSEIQIRLNITTDNSNYDLAAGSSSGNQGTGEIRNCITSQFIFDVTDISTHKFKFSTSNFASGTFVAGNSGASYSGFTVIRIGDT